MTEVAALSLTGVSKSYGPVRALAEVSLDVFGGRVHALLGENGAGKSTLMGIASGSTQPDEGTITVAGEPIGALTTDRASRLGIAIVHQHPAVVADMTVAENIRLAVPAERMPAGTPRVWMAELLRRVGADLRLQDRVADLSVAQKQLLELAKAIALEPKVLILDEPTAPLGAEQTEILFDQVRQATARGTAVVYITHRLAEVREIADEVTVLRDGRARGHAAVADLTDDEMLRMIVGRELASTFPEKDPDPALAKVALAVEGLSGEGFHDARLVAHHGEIVGLAGIVGNGQSEFLRALAGLRHSTGRIVLDGVRLRGRALVRSTAYMPADRHRESLLPAMSVRENAAVSALPSFAGGGVVSGERERAGVDAELAKLSVKTASRETNVMALSGGNQQKVVMARALLAAPRLLLADEPTQGVDVGARSEIYTIMRDVAASGVPVVVVSSDAKELEGLCDRVVVFSRGHVVTELTGDEVTEEKITGAVVNATTHRGETPPAKKAEKAPEARPARTPMAERVRDLAKGDYAPSLVLALVILALGGYTFAHNVRFLAPFNVTSLLTLLTALAFISLGQTIVIMTGGIDLSVGPLAGLLVVIASFFVTDGHSPVLVVLAFVIMLAVAVLSGVLNGLLIRFGGFTAVAATLTLYIGLQGISLLLRPFQGGFISTSVTDAITVSVGFVPVAFIVAVVVAVALELALRFTAWGRGLRAAGSNEGSALRLGVKVNRVHVLAYVGCAVLTFFGALLLMAQIGVGDPTQGVSYTLSSITAVVLGGASLAGGRGSFIGTLLGATLIQEVLNATTFLNLSQSWQYFFQGILILIAAAIYTRVRRRTPALV
ncbi:ATP-binding cassette domain-containing protein [Amycolatopsis sp. FDAARGOS 1241]|uniref:ATP-binding cassette domain-containing protein n=1 Tax=Amycolatopsis sp. FDAARGOS 1241 TaxID=2778070 RepID=UPI0019514E30|nr:ATP-binding cassette domain-containing protein [Amycolatopsis sp. FDAARGOS 1241]QRP49392.1 ATP-binding cassette domain-containing protein [Amycolatopsis sp. FDAARGOS 1241]